MTQRIATGPGHLTGWEDHRLATHRHCPGQAGGAAGLIGQGAGNRGDGSQ